MAISYKSYCWVVGTTSFRTSQLNRKIELQLGYLDELWSDRRFCAQPWSENDPLQRAYYELLKEKGFVTGDAPRPEKDAREKTSGLVGLGLLNSERRLTGAGRKVLAISRAGDFGIDTSNMLDLSKDGYQYFLQLLKATKPFEGGYVRPFVIFLHVLNKVIPDGTNRKYLTASEFANLLPMCVDASTTKAIVGTINEARRSGRPLDVDSTIVSVLMRMENYREALAKFRSARTIDEDLICLIGINRKSGANGVARYDAPYLGVFQTLHEIVFKGATTARLNAFVEALNFCNLKSSWLKYLFDKGTGRRLPKDLSSVLRRDNAILQAKTEDDFRCAFFKVMHLLKAKATFKDYADLNRRYFCLTDVVVFNEEVVELDLLPKAFVAKIGGWLEVEAFRDCGLLEQDIPLGRIVTMALPQKDELVVAATGRSLASVTAGGGTKAVLKVERYSRFSTMLHQKFPIETIRKLLEMVEDRSNDAEVQKLVTDNADVPTIFEYLVGLAWYYVSGEQGDVLEYMNLSLGPDFLPKTHAGGGEADIVWQYSANPPHYEKHALLIEVTLAERDSQRRMEMEPVSRHIGQYLLTHPTEHHSYCTFATTNLDLNVISDYRGKKHQTFYDPLDRTRHVDGMKIMPIDTKMLRRMLERRLGYATVYKMFDDHFNREGDPATWHDGLRAAIDNGVCSGFVDAGLNGDSIQVEGVSLTQAKAKRVPPVLTDIGESLKFREYLPLYSYRAACGKFSNGTVVEPEGWIRVDGLKGRNERLFVLRVQGRSMEPKIPDGSYCVFEAPEIAVEREGQILLVQYRGAADPETGGAYTVKRYVSKDSDSRLGEAVVLKPINKAFKEMRFASSEESALKPIAAFKRIL